MGLCTSPPGVTEAEAAEGPWAGRFGGLMASLLPVDSHSLLLSSPVKRG